MAVLAQHLLKHPIRFGEAVRSRLEVSRYANLGDFIECEKRGWMSGGDVRDDCELQYTGYMLWQLCGVTPDEYVQLDTRDLPAVVEWLRPFVLSGTPPTGEATQPT